MVNDRLINFTYLVPTISMYDTTSTAARYLDYYFGHKKYNGYLKLASKVYMKLVKRK